MNTTKSSPDEVRGYLEGYYGKLLTWEDRHSLLECLAANGLNTYCYAPKEDPLHRLHWREPYNTHWRESLQQFCDDANNHNIRTVVGIAPGLDFNHKERAIDSGHLFNKAKQMLLDGVHEVLILWDDIEAPAEDCAKHEGKAHARAVNHLSESLGRPLWTVPRVYAAEIEDSNQYLEDFFTTLNPQSSVLLCGKAIVASEVKPVDLTHLEDTINTHSTILWDNFYANDYCPRRLFLGPWVGREEITNYLLNATGMPFTDKLLLDIASSTQAANDRQNQFHQALDRHGVPEVFHLLAPYFTEPFFGDRTLQSNSLDTACAEPTIAIESAIEECLWKWKSPLAREWYPFLFGLKHDLALMQGKLPRDRIVKTQTPAMAKRLLSCDSVENT